MSERRAHYTPDEIGHPDPVRTVNTARLTPRNAPELVVERVETAPEVVEVDTETGEIVHETAPEAPTFELESAVVDAPIVPETVADEPETAPDQPLTSTQSGLISAAIKALEFGKAEGLAFYSATVGRPIKATRELTRDEAELVISELSKLRDDA